MPVSNNISQPSSQTYPLSPNSASPLGEILNPIQNTERENDSNHNLFSTPGEASRGNPDLFAQYAHAVAAQALERITEMKSRGYNGQQLLSDVSCSWPSSQETAGRLDQKSYAIVKQERGQRRAQIAANIDSICPTPGFHDSDGEQKPSVFPHREFETSILKPSQDMQKINPVLNPVLISGLENTQKLIKNIFKVDVPEDSKNPIRDRITSGVVNFQIQAEMAAALGPEILPISLLADPIAEQAKRAETIIQNTPSPCDKFDAFTSQLHVLATGTSCEQQVAELQGMLMLAQVPSSVMHGAHDTLTNVLNRSLDVLQLTDEAIGNAVSETVKFYREESKPDLILQIMP